MEVYFYHLWLNLNVAFNGFKIMMWHLAHGLLPCKYTSHKYWKIDLCFNKKGEGE